MSAVVIRPGHASEVVALQDIEVRSGELFREIGMDDIADAPPAETALFNRSLQQELLYVAERDRTPAGFALMLDHGDSCHLQQLSVDPMFARQGIGARLVEEAAAVAADRGYARMTLSTFSNVAWNGPFYMKLGFAVLPPDQLSADLHACRSAEEAAGLDMSRRVMMVKPLR